MEKSINLEIGLRPTYTDSRVMKLIFRKINKQIKKSLIKKANTKIEQYLDQQKSSLRVSELRYFPMFIKKGPISIRTTFKEDCKRYFNEN